MTSRALSARLAGASGLFRYAYCHGFLSGPESSKGRALRGAVGVDMDAYDLVFVVGGEADEDVFELFEGSSHSFTVSTGRHLSHAQFFVDDQEVLPTLQTLAAVSNLSDRIDSMPTLASAHSSSTFHTAPLA